MLSEAKHLATYVDRFLAALGMTALNVLCSAEQGASGLVLGSRARRFTLLAAAIIGSTIGCGALDLCEPDQAAFDPLSSLESSGEAVVRLYVAPFPGFELFAVHPWFAVKRADATTFDRWEVWYTAAEPFGYVRLNRLPPASGVGAGAARVLVELVGPDAEPVVEFIETQSPTYPCGDFYAYFPGPNSNTYVQWVLDQTGWAVTLPPSAVGKCFPPDCP